MNWLASASSSQIHCSFEWIYLLWSASSNADLSAMQLWRSLDCNRQKVPLLSRHVYQLLLWNNTGIDQFDTHYYFVMKFGLRGFAVVTVSIKVNYDVFIRAMNEHHKTQTMKLHIFCCLQRNLLNQFDSIDFSGLVLAVDSGRLLDFFPFDWQS